MSIVLLNSEGFVSRKLQLVSLPSDYVVPEGMMVSWKTSVDLASSDPIAAWRGPREPEEAYFYLGNAYGKVSRTNFKPFVERAPLGMTYYGLRTLVVTVQGSVAKDVMELRDRILQLINSKGRWGASNDLNPVPPKIKWFQRLIGMVS